MSERAAEAECKGYRCPNGHEAARFVGYDVDPDTEDETHYFECAVCEAEWWVG